MKEDRPRTPRKASSNTRMKKEEKENAIQKTKNRKILCS